MGNNFNKIIMGSNAKSGNNYILHENQFVFVKRKTKMKLCESFVFDPIILRLAELISIGLQWHSRNVFIGISMVHYILCAFCLKRRKFVFCDCNNELLGKIPRPKTGFRNIHKQKWKLLLYDVLIQVNFSSLQ